MDMGMTTMSMATATATATSTGSMTMSMSSTATASSSMDMDMDTNTSMTMTFFTSARTPLFSTSWTPTSDGQYAGTCIFLIVLALILRFILALRPSLEAHVWNDHTASSIAHDHVHIEQRQQQQEQPKINPFASPLSNVRRDFASRWAGWRVNAAVGRATYELVISGIAYLLMLAVMTFNVGYFLSVLAGIWLGTFILGGAAADNLDNLWSHC